jgi:hypothetical protein
MCYAPRVMLRGCCSCAISERPTPSLFVSPSLLRLLTPLFPLHPRNSPVTPLFPLLTQKQGGGGGVTRMVTYLKYVGAPTFSPSVTSHKSRTTSHAGNLLNCKLSTEHPTRILILSEPGESKDHSSSESATLNCRLSLPRGGANFHSRLSLDVHTPLYAEVPRIQEHAYE